MSRRTAEVIVPGIDSPIQLALHVANDRYISDGIDEAGTWEPFETELVRRAIRPGDLVVDAGANLGWYSVIAGLLGAEVIAFEPMSANLELLRENLRLNGVEELVRVEPRALGRAAGEAQLQLSPDNQGDHRVSIRPDGTVVAIEMTTLDDATGGRVPRLLKLDTQGSEVNILRGARSTLAPAATQRTVMIVEFWPFGLADCGSSAEELVGIVSAYVPATHDCFEIIEASRHLRPITPGDLARSALAGDYSPEAGGHTNIVLVPHADKSLYADLVAPSEGAEHADGRFDLHTVERSVHSQFGEDGVIEALASRTRCPSSIVEFGAGDGQQCNSRYPRERGWDVAAFDGDPGATRWVRRAWITAENVEPLLESTGLADRLGVLSVDLDGNDYWVLRSLLRRARPAIIVVEYNASLGPVEALTVTYRPSRRWDHTNYFGASIAAFALLCADRGYALIGCSTEGVNAYFVRTDLLDPAGLSPASVHDAYRPPAYGVPSPVGGHSGHRPTSRRFMRVESDAAAELGYRSAVSRLPARIVRRAHLALVTADAYRYQSTWSTNLRNRLRGLPTK